MLVPDLPAFRGLAAALLLALWVRCMCRGRPPLRRTLLAGLLAGAPALLAWSVTGTAARAAWIQGGCAAAGAIGGLWLLRRWLRGPPSSNAWEQAWRGLLALGLAALAGWAGARWHERAGATLHQLEVQALQRDPAPAPDPAGPVRLDASSAVEWSGPWRNFVLSGEATLEPGAILELRCRTPERPDPVGSSARGVALLVSAEAGLPPGLYLEDSARFERLGDALQPIAAGARVHFEIRAEGRAVHATVSGAACRASTRLFPEGGVQVLALRGAVELHRLELQPAVFAEDAPSRSHLLAPALAPLLVLITLAFATGRLLRTGLIHAASVLAFALMPLAWVLVESAGEPSPAALAMAALAQTALCLAYPVVHSAHLTFPRFLLLGLLAVAAAVGLGRLLGSPRSWPPSAEEMNHLSYVEWSGPRLDDGLLHLQHPLLRRFRFQLADHRFRGRRFTVDKPAGTTRVIALGGSSTWGLQVADGEDYPTLMEPLLAEALHTPVEVINAAYPAAVSSRLRRVLEHDLLQFAPDVVTLSLTYNDAVVLTGSDEEAYFRRITDPDYERTWLDDFRARMQADRDRRLAVELFAAFARGDRPLWPAEHGPSPAERFEHNLRRFADLARTRGFTLVLIREPLRGNGPWIWKDELYAAIDRVGREHGLVVVDPTPALQRAGAAALFMDLVHPLPEGYAVIAREVAAGVARALGR